MDEMSLIYYVAFLFFGLSEAALHDSVGCSSDEFSCKNGQCILKLNWCDGYADCKDDSDENYCRYGLNSDPNQCAGDPSFFLCNDGRCIPIEGKCDGIKSCSDDSDEEYCDYSTINPEITTVVTEYIGSSTFQENRKGPQNSINHDSNTKRISDLRYDHNNLKSAHRWLLSQWNEDTAWGADTARAIIALHLSETENFSSKEQKILINKQLDVQLFVALTRNSSKTLSLCELSHYINAISATCRNPRSFNGHDLVGVLRERVDVLNNRHAFVTPYVYLTLCIHNFTKYEDLLNMWKIVRSSLSVAHNFDMLSLSVLTVSCAIRRRSLNNPNFRTDILDQLIKKIDKSGIPKSVYELSLIVQALTEANVDPLRWNKTEAIGYILNSQDETGSFGDFLATYYTIPILSGKSMLDISEHCNVNFPAVVQQTDFKHLKINVIYSLYFDYPVELTQKILLQVNKGSNFLDVMRLAQEENPYFRFQLDDTKDIPFVYMIGGMPNDPERGLYWTLYVNSSNAGSELIRYNSDIRHHFPKENEETIFWLRPI